MCKIKQVANGKWELIGGTGGEKLVEVRINFPDGKSEYVNGTSYYIAGLGTATIKIIFPNGFTETIPAVPADF